MEILSGVHLIPDLRWSNAYLLVEEERLTLVDAGLPGAPRKSSAIFSTSDGALRSWSG